MATLEQLRAVFGGQSDEETIYAASQKLRLSPTEIADEVGFKVGGKWGNRASAAVDSYQANLYGLGEAMGSTWAGQRRQSNEAAADLSRAFAREQGAIGSYKDIKGFGDAADYIGGLAIDSAPYLGEALLGGVVGRGLMTGAKTAASIGRELGMPAAVQAANRNLGRGATAGAVAASYPSAVGDILSSQREENGQMDLGSAAALGVPYAALNAFGLEGAAARGQMFRNGISALDNIQGVRGGLARAGATAAGTGFQEGLSETGQEFINQAGRNAVNPNAGYFGQQALDRYAESFVGGAALGGVLGGAGGGWRRSESYKPPVSDEPGVSTDLLTLGNTPSLRDQVQGGFDPNPGRLGGFTPAGPRPGSRVLQMPEAPGDVTPEWGLSQGAGQPTEPGLDFSSAYQAAGEPPLFSASGRRGPDPMGQMPGVDMPPLVADQAGAVGTNPADATALYGRDDGDLGVALARERYLEQTRQAAQQRQTAEAVQAKAAEQRAEAERVRQILGGKIKPGSIQVQLLQELEAQRDAGLIDQTAFEGDAALLSNGRLGDVKKRIKERANAAGAGTDGRTGTADVGGGAGNQRAPGQPGGVRPAGPQPAAQGVPGAGATQLGPRGPGGDVALKPASAPVLGTKAADAPARVAQTIGRELSPAESQVATRLANASARDQAIMRDVLGWDENNDQVNEPLSYEQLGEKYTNEAGPNKGKPMSRQAVQAVLRKMGITEAVADSIRSSYTAPVSAEDLGIANDGEATGFRVTDKAAAGKDDFELDARTVRQQNETETAIAQAGPAANAAADAEIGARKSVTDSEFDAKRQALADAERAAAQARAPRQAKTVEDILARDLARNDIAPVDIEDAAQAWDDEKLDVDPAFAMLDPRIQAQVVRAYRNEVLTAQRQGELIDENAQLSAARAADGEGSAQGAGRVAGPGAVALGGPAGPGATGSRAEGRTGSDEDVSWGDQAAQMSRDTERDDGTTYHTAETLEDSLLSFMNTDALGKRVVIVETASDLTDANDILAAFDDTAVAWARNGRAYLIADRIPVGNERGVFMHEVGGHLGLERLLGEKEYSRLVGKLVGWAARNDNSQESILARKAKERVDKAGTEGAEARNAELVAYFLEEAVNAGLNPTAMQYDTPVRQWLRTLWAAFKVGLRRLGVSIDKLNAQDVVNLGYGAARITITGRFHGTAADVQQFRTKYIGTGEGAQAYGWGLYFSELRGVAEDYKKSDVQRKFGSGLASVKTMNNPANPDKVKASLRALAAAVKSAVAKEGAFNGPINNDTFTVSKVLGTLRALRYGSNLHSDFMKDVVRIWRSVDGLQTPADAVDYVTTAWARKNADGNLYATDIAVKPDEFLDWTLPLEEQPARVQEILAKYPDIMEAIQQDAETGYGRFNNSGGGLYHYLEAQAMDNQGPFEPDFALDDYLDEMGDKYDAWEVDGSVRTLRLRDEVMTPEELTKLNKLQADARAARELERKSAPERVSRWLDSIGIKGVRMPVNYTRGGTYDEGRNFVVFNEKNVIKALDNPASRVSKSIQFSKSVPPQAADQLAAAQAKVTESLSPKAKDAWTTVRDFFKRNSPYFLTNFQIAEQFGGTGPGKIKSLKDYVKIADLMRMETVKQQMEFDAVATRWDSLPKAARAMLDDITQRATLREMHPDLAFTDKANGHLKGRDGAQAEHTALAAKYKQMANTHPEAAKVYQEAKAVLEKSRQRMVDASNKLYADYGIKKTVPNEMAGPYFPLMRFGEYLAIGESADYLALADELAQTPPGEARTALQKRLDAMKRDPKHYIVSAHEGRAAMERAVEQYRRQGLEARPNMASQRLEALPKDVHSMVAQLANQMAGKFDGATATAFIDEYKALLVKALPELHALNRAAERKGVEGASPDMLRAFAAAGRQNAFYTARLMHAKDAAQTMQDMKGEVKGNIDMQHVHREMEKRAALDLQFKDTPLQDMAGTAAWVYYLGASPTFLFMNTTQPWLVTAPVLAGKYGFAKTTKALGQASREALQVLRDARWKDGKWSPWEGISESSVATTRKNAEGVSEDRKALRELMQRGIVDEGLQHELRTFAEGGNRTLAKFGRWTGWASQQIELVNRTATALATFRLAREQGMDYDAAVNEAYRVTTNTQMDYSAEGTARFMREGGGIPLAKLLFQFRRYQQTMLYVLGDNIKKLADPAERKVAAKSLAYFAMTSGMAAGAMGLPFAGTIMMVANAFMDDDDERGDAKTRLRNLMFDLTGDKDMADVLAKGIPAAFGADLSARIGLGDIAQLYPRLELNGRTGEENVGKVAAAVLGPSAGLATQFFQAGIHFSNGDWAKGTEKMVPKMVADVLRAGRYSAQGMTDGKGETILGPDEISAWDKLLRAAGTTAINESNYYEGTKAKKDVETAINERKGQIQREYRRAIRSGDFEDVRAMIEEFNADHPDARIKPKDEVAWRREAGRSAGQRDTTGIQFNPKRDANLGEVMRFARG